MSTRASDAFERDPQHVASAAALPDVRDGLTQLERIILCELATAQREYAGRRVPTALLYGRVVEQISVSVPVFQATLRRLLGR